MHEPIIVGAGQAGLATSYHLKQRGIDHVLLDRGRPGEIWRTQRWDSFVLNTPNLANSLPGKSFYPENPGAFESTVKLVNYFENYVEDMELPFHGGINVLHASRNPDGQSIDVVTTNGVYRTNHLVVASGMQNVPTLPEAANGVPPNITSLDTAEYRNPEQLPAGSVLVIGSGQSGIQVTEDLLAAGRTVYLSTSKVGRFRRRFRGKDIVEWLIESGMAAHTPSDLENPEEQYATQPVLTGIGGGRTISLQSISDSGAILLGRIESFEGSTANFKNNLRENIEFGDAFSSRIHGRLNDLANKKFPDAPPIEDDPPDNPAPKNFGLDASTRLNLDEASISTIVWTTGFTGDYSWIDLEGHTLERGRPVQTNGASPAKGLYFIGQPWLRTRTSGIIFGVADDARIIAKTIASNA